METVFLMKNLSHDIYAHKLWINDQWPTRFKSNWSVMLRIGYNTFFLGPQSNEMAHDPTLLGVEQSCEPTMAIFMGIAVR